MNPHVLCIGGNDHALRVPFLLALRNLGFRVSAAGTGDSTPFLRAELDYHAFQFDRSFSPRADWATFKAVSRLVADLRPDIVQSFDTKPNWLTPLAARQAGTLAVRTINGLALVYSSRSLRARAFRPVWRALHRLAARATAMTVFQNRDDQDFFRRYGLIGSGGSRLIAGSGIDVARLRQSVMAGPPPEEIRRRLGLGSSEVVITVTRMTREKGVPVLLEAAALVHAVRPSVRFLLVGPRDSEGSAAVSQEEIDRHAPYVVYAGSTADVAPLLALADVFAFPTEYREGVPRVLLEAAAAGLPMVTTNMPGCRDVVRDGVTGIIVPPRAPQLLARRILELVGDKNTARELGARARELVEREFSLSLVVSRYAALYRELVLAREKWCEFREPATGDAAAHAGGIRPAARRATKEPREGEARGRERSP